MIVDVTEARARPLLDRAVEQFRGGGDPQAYLDAGGAIAFVALGDQGARRHTPRRPGVVLGLLPPPA